MASASPNPSALTVFPNLLLKSISPVLAEVHGVRGSSLTLTFSPPIAELRGVNIGVNDRSGPAMLSVEVLNGNTSIVVDHVNATPSVKGALSEVLVNLNVGQPFDRVIIRSQNAQKQFAVSEFQVCAQEIAAGDLDLNGGVDHADGALLAACLSGPVVPIGSWCWSADLDGDGDVDLRGWADFGALFEAP